MEYFIDILEWISAIVALFSILVLVWGVLVCAYRFFRIQLRRHRGSVREGLIALTESKNALGVYILLSLEILIAADIIDSIAKPTFEDIFKVGLIVAIRTVIAYFLDREIHETLVPQTHLPPAHFHEDGNKQ